MGGVSLRVFFNNTKYWVVLSDSFGRVQAARYTAPGEEGFVGSGYPKTFVYFKNEGYEDTTRSAVQIRVPSGYSELCLNDYNIFCLKKRTKVKD